VSSVSIVCVRPVCEISVISEATDLESSRDRPRPSIVYMYEYLYSSSIYIVVAVEPASVAYHVVPIKHTRIVVCGQFMFALFCCCYYFFILPLLSKNELIKSHLKKEEAAREITLSIPVYI